MTVRRSRLVFSLIAVISLIPAACRRSSPSVVAEQVTANVEQASAGRLDYSAKPAASPSAAGVVSGLRAEGTVNLGVGRGPANRGVPVSVAQPAGAVSMVIRTGTTSIEVQALDAAIQRVHELADRLGGYVGNTTTQTGRGQTRSATLELKIPAARFDEAVNGLSPLGEVESVNVHAEDVGEEFVDLTARTANAKRLEERLLALLSARTGKLDEVVQVERELARVREEIERFDGRLRYLRSRLAMSTLTVTVHEPATVMPPRVGPSVMGEAFRQAWRNGVEFVAALIASLGWLIPLSAIATVFYVVWRRFGSRPAAPLPEAPARPEA